MKTDVRLILALFAAAIYFVVAMTGIVLRFDGTSVFLLALLQMFWATLIGGNG